MDCFREYQKELCWYSPFVNIKYKKDGYDRSGINCIGLVILYYREALNIKLPVNNLLEFRKKFKIIKKEFVEDNDIVFMLNLSVNHVGIYNSGYVLHSSPDIMKSVINKAEELKIVYAAKYIEHGW